MVVEWGHFLRALTWVSITVTLHYLNDRITVNACGGGSSSTLGYLWFGQSNDDSLALAHQLQKGNYTQV